MLDQTFERPTCRNSLPPNGLLLAFTGWDFPEPNKPDAFSGPELKALEAYPIFGMSIKGVEWPWVLMSSAKSSLNSRTLVRNLISLIEMTSYRPRRACNANDWKSCAIVERYVLFCSIVFRGVPKESSLIRTESRRVCMVESMVGKVAWIRLHKRAARYLFRGCVPRRSSGSLVQGRASKKSFSLICRSKGSNPSWTSLGVRFRMTNHPWSKCFSLFCASSRTCWKLTSSA